MKRHGLLLLAGLLLAVVASWLLVPAATAPGGGGREGARVADFYIHGLSAVRMDPTGRPRERLTATRLVHYPDEQAMDVTAPLLVMYRPPSTGEAPWQLSARQGTLFEDRHEISLAGDVTLVQEAPRPLRLTTETMLIDTIRQTAAGDDPVTLTEPGSKMEGVGLRASLPEGRAELLSRVRGVHAP